MHTPKTGSSFIYTLLRAGCPGVDMPWLLNNTRLKRDEELHWPVEGGKQVNPGAVDKVAASRVVSDPASRCAQWVAHMHMGHHEPPAPAEVEARGVNLLAMFREPGARLLSLYVRKELFKRRRAAKGLPYEIRGCPGCPRTLQRSVDPADIDAFLRVPGVAGCVSRSLTGEYCGADDVAPMRMRADAAASRVRAMRFAGLTGHWDLSICLFHRVFGLPQPLHSQGVNIRPTDYGGGSGTTGAPARRLAGAPTQNATAIPEWFHDAADDVVYAAATQRFAELLREHGASSECTADARRNAEDARARADASARLLQGKAKLSTKWERFLAPLEKALDGGSAR